MKKKSFHLLALVLAVTMLLSATTFAAPQDHEGLMYPSANGSVREDVFTTEVADAYEEGEEIFDVLVYLNAEPDVTVYENRYTTYQGLDRENAVYDMVGELKQNAATTQAPIVRYLENMKSRGLVDNYETFYIVNAIHMVANRSVIEQLSLNPAIKKIELNRKISMIEVEDVQEVQVNPDKIADNIKQIGAPGAWQEFGITGKGTVIGIIDSGADYEHPALKNKWRGYDLEKDMIVEPEKNWFEAIPSYFTEQSPIPVDSRLTHGTHCLGIAIGGSANGENMVGVAPEAKYIASRAFGPDGETEGYVLLRACQWMLAPGDDPTARPDIVTCSWADNNLTSLFYQEIIKKWRAAGILPVFAAGNQRRNEPTPGPYSIENPGNLHETFAVGAVNKDNHRASFSKIGPSIFDKEKENKKIKPDITAPGFQILSSVIGGGYAYKSGTSMATPHVAGTAALLKQANPDLTIEEIEEVLKQTATPATDGEYPESPNMAYGYGVVNAYRAVASVMNKDFAVIRGRTLIQGEDLNAPRITVNIPDVTFENQIINIDIWAQDDIGVSSIVFEYQPFGSTDYKTAKVTQIKGNAQSGEYQVKIPREDVVAGVMNFRWEAHDSYGNVTSGSDSRDIRGPIDPRVGYFNDFETEAEGWLFHNDFEFGEMYGWSMPDWKGAYSGVNAIGTKLAGYEITKYTTHWAQTPTIDLSDTTMDQPSADFMVRYFGTPKDYDMSASVSVDGGETWKKIKTYEHNIQYWIRDHLDLSEFKGNRNVVIRFELALEDGYDRGFYIDDFAIRVNPETTPNEPTEVKAGIAVKGTKVSFTHAADVVDTAYYNVYRKSATETDFTVVGTHPVIYEGKMNQNFYVDTTVDNNMEYTYYLTAVDYYGNESVPSNQAVVMYETIPAIYYSDFEADDGGLNPIALKNDVVDWEWGIGEHVIGNNSKLWGTNLDTGVTPNSEYSLNTPKLNIPTGGALLSFKSYIDIYWSSQQDQASGFAYVEAKEEGGDWETLFAPDVLMQRKDRKTWLSLSTSLDQYAGKTIELRFRLEVVPHANSNPDFPEYGWCLDDLQVVPPGVEVTTWSSDMSTQKDLTEAEINALPQAWMDDQSDVELDSYPEPLPAQTIPKHGVIVSLPEIGQSVRSTMIGEYELRPTATPEGREVTVEAVAEGYKPYSSKLTVKNGDDILHDIVLEPLGLGQLEIKILDAATDEPLENAYIRILNSAKDIVKTTADGLAVFSDVYEGTHKIKISAAGYEIVEQEVVVKPNEINSITIKVNKIDEFSEWVKFENGPNTSLGWAGAGVGFAMRFVAEGHGTLRAGKFFFVNNHPGFEGWESGIGVLRENKELGTLETLVDFGRHEIKRGAWNEFDFTKYGIKVKPGDVIYLSTLQLHDPNYMNPAIGLDQFSPNRKDAFIYNGSMRKWSDEDPDMHGAFCIRAQFAYTEKEIFAPVFTDLKTTEFFNKKLVTLTGTTKEDGDVVLTLNGTELAPVKTEEKKFSIQVELQEGVNKVSAVLKANGNRVSESSQVHTLILDETAPLVTITEPADNAIIDGRMVKVKGTVEDVNLDRVYINEVPIELVGNAFEKELYLELGKNKITVDAYDKVNNHGSAAVDVYVREDVFEIERIDGLSRYEVAVAFSQKNYTTVDTAIICSGTAWGDALSAGPLSLKLDAPILLTDKKAIPESTLAELKRLQVKNVIIVGGPVSISEDAEKQLKQVASVRRIWGQDRYLTSLEVAKEVLQNNQVETAVFCGGKAFADAVAIAPMADRIDSKGIAPIVLVNEDNVPKLKGLDKCLIMGGPVSIPQVVADKIKAQGYTAERIGEQTRYHNSIKVVEKYMPNPSTIMVANGEAIADCLVSARFCNRHNIPLVLTTNNSLLPVTKDYIEAQELQKIYIAGGPVTISKALELELYRLKW